MAYKIIYKAYAERDLWELADYLSDYSLSAAEKFLLAVKTKIERLKDTPLIYPLIDPGYGYRKMVVGRHIVIYMVNEQAKEVLILRVVHGKRDYQNNI